MGLKMKNYEGWLKNQIFRGRFMKNQCAGGIAYKGTLGQFTNLRGWGGLAKKSGVVFLKGSWHTNAHYETWCLVA